MSFAVVNAKYNDPVSNAFDTRNVLVQGKKITGVGYIPDEDEESLTVVDATKSVLIPCVSDFIYMPHSEQILSAINTIFSNGIQKIVFLPNVHSNLLDDPDVIADLISNLPDEIKKDVVFSASATIANGVDQLTELSLLAKAGAGAIYFDRIIENKELLVQALQFMNVIDCPIIFGPMTTMITSLSHLNDGVTSFEIGIKGESINIEDYNVVEILNLLDKYYKGPVHFQVISSANSIELIHQYREKTGQEITIGVSPFHCEIDDSVLENYEINYKFNPPFRSLENKIALNSAFKEGKIDHMTSLHVPPTGDIYPKSFFDQPFGVDTIDSFLHLAAHLLVKHDISLGNFSSYFQLPHQFNSALNQSTIEIHQFANFSVLRSSQEFKQTRTFLKNFHVETYGGLVASVKNGTLYNI